MIPLGYLVAALVGSTLVLEFSRCPRCGHLYYAMGAPMVAYGRGCHHCGLNATSWS